jgi:DNA-directed RNA polymerase specialized sigma24 family protein
VSGKHGRGRLRVEAWEVDLVKQVAHAYRSDREELEAELFSRLTQLKANHKEAWARDWKSYLARSLYNAANNFVRDQELRDSRIQSLEIQHEDDAPASLLDLLPAPEEALDLRIDLSRLRNEMSPQLRDLWDLLVEEQGNVSATAKKLGRPRKTVDYWIQNLKRFLKNRAL